MKITSSRLDDLRRAKSEYETDLANKQAQYEGQKKSYHKATADYEADIADSVMSHLSGIKINLDIEVNLRYHNFSIRVSHGEINDRDTASLRWNYTVEFNPFTNEIEKETNSWSGLQATTVDQVDDLKESVKAIEILVNMNWDNIVASAMSQSPKLEDYITMNNPQYDEHEDYDSQILEEQLKPLIGSDNIVKFKNGYKFVVKSTPKFYYVIPLPGKYTISNDATEDDVLRFKNYNPSRVRKEDIKYMVEDPTDIESVSVSEYLNLMKK